MKTSPTETSKVMATEKTLIKIEANINAPVEKVWKYWVEPSHITQWAFASSDWHAPTAENDVRANGKFKTTMAAKDGSVSFDFEGVYTKVEPQKTLEYKIADGRIVKVTFSASESNTSVVETFEAEDVNSIDMQKAGWQAILNNFKNHVENN
jgi:uncharacterized protein YndB with AHSA1/START domain